MCKLTITAGLCLIIASLASSSRLVCYFNSLAENRAANGKFTVSHIDPSQCTHLIYASSDISNQLDLVPSNAVDTQRYLSFNGLKTRNPQLKTLLAVGGSNFNKQKFSRMASKKDNRDRFIESAIKLLRANGFDGLNLDWRYPGGAGSRPQDKSRFTMLCKELKNAFVAEGEENSRDRLILTATVSAERETIDASYEVAQIAMYLDFINVMTFDFHGPWENVTGHHSPLFRGSQDTGDKIYFNTDSAMKYWQDQGAPPQKLNIGFAAYGRAFSLSSAASDVGAPAKGAGEEGCYTGEEGFWSFYETCLYLEGVATQKITDQKVPYATTEKQWVGFDNKDSLGYKVSYLKTNNFGGAFVWSLDLDDFSGQFCKQGNYPFVSHLHTLLDPGFPGFTTKASPTTTTTSPPTTTTTIPPTTTTTTPPPTATIPPTTTTTAPPTIPPTTTTTTTPPPTTTATIPPTTTTTAPPTIPPTTTTTPPTTTTTTPPPTTTATIPPTTTTTAPPTIPPTTTTTPPTTTTTTPPPTTTATIPPTTTTKAPPTIPPTAPTTTTTRAVGPNGNLCNGREDGVYPNPANPNSFINCANQISHIQPCPENLVFNPSCSCCDFP